MCCRATALIVGCNFLLMPQLNDGLLSYTDLELRVLMRNYPLQIYVDVINNPRPQLKGDCGLSNLCQ